MESTRRNITSLGLCDSPGLPNEHLPSQIKHHACASAASPAASPSDLLHGQEPGSTCTFPYRQLSEALNPHLNFLLSSASSELSSTVVSRSLQLETPLAKSPAPTDVEKFMHFSPCVSTGLAFTALPRDKPQIAHR